MVTAKTQSSTFSIVSKYYTELCAEHNIKTTDDISLDTDAYAEVIGQAVAVEYIKLAIFARRHVLLIGEPGTGKSLLAKVAARSIPRYDFRLLSLNNVRDSNKPNLKHYTTEQLNWPQYVRKYKHKPITAGYIIGMYLMGAVLYVMYSWYRHIATGQTSPFEFTRYILSPLSHLPVVIIATSSLVDIQSTINLMLITLKGYNALAHAHCMYDSTFHETPNFIDATGASDTVLLGSVSHDPLAGLHADQPLKNRTFALFTAGAVHKAHNGILYIDEIGTLQMDTQYSLLTILQEKKAYIKSQLKGASTTSAESDNALPANFSLVMAGNIETIGKIHIALRSRIKGYGYEVYMNSSTPITKATTYDLLTFFAREVKKNNYLPITQSGMLILLYHAVICSRVARNYTLELRNFAGIIRTAFDYAITRNYTLLTAQVIRTAISDYPGLQKQIINITTLSRTSAKYNMPALITVTKTPDENANNIQSIELCEGQPLIVDLEFITSNNIGGGSVDIPSLRLQSRHARIVNKISLLERYIKTKLATFINVPDSQTLNIYLLHKQLAHFIPEENNLLFTILGQYYRPSSDYIYIGNIATDGSITAEPYTLNLIDVAIKKGYKIVVAKSLKPLLTHIDMTKIEYITHIRDLYNITHTQWM